MKQLLFVFGFLIAACAKTNLSPISAWNVKLGKFSNNMSSATIWGKDSTVTYFTSNTKAGDHFDYRITQDTTFT